MMAQQETSTGAAIAELSEFDEAEPPTKTSAVNKEHQEIDVDSGRLEPTSLGMM